MEIATTATVRAAAYEDDNVEGGLVTTVSAAVDNGSLEESIVNGGVGSMTSISVTGVDSPTVSVSQATAQPAPNDNGSWEALSLSILVVNAIGIVAFSLYMRQKLTQAGRPVSFGNVVAISLGWIDQVSDFLFGVELIGFTTNASAAVKAIGAVSLFWFVATSVFNYVQWQKIVKENEYDKAVVLREAELYGAMQIFMLGSLDLMTIFPWTDPNVQHTHSYPSKVAVVASIRSSMLEDTPQLLFGIAFFVLSDGVTTFMVINCAVTVLTLLWTVFTKSSILGAFDAHATTTGGDGDPAGPKNKGPTAAVDLEVEMVPSPAPAEVSHAATTGGGGDGDPAGPKKESPAAAVDLDLEMVPSQAPAEVSRAATTGAGDGDPAGPKKKVPAAAVDLDVEMALSPAPAEVSHATTTRDGGDNPPEPAAGTRRAQLISEASTDPRDLLGRRSVSQTSDRTTAPAPAAGPVVPADVAIESASAIQ